MKRLVIVLVVLATVGATAQRNDGPKKNRQAMKDLTVEQVATLQTKKLTLLLDLTAKQQNQVMEINLAEVEMRRSSKEERKSKKESGEFEKPTAEERFEMANARLDFQIAQQQQMKEVLTEDQYEVWKKLKIKKGMDSKKKMRENGRRG